jgi:hypothetical protein
MSILNAPTVAFSTSLIYITVGTPDPRTFLKDLHINGNTATGKLNERWTVEFRRVNGRWLFDLTNYGGVNGIFLMDYLRDIQAWSF